MTPINNRLNVFTTISNSWLQFGSPQLSRA